MQTYTEKIRQAAKRLLSEKRVDAVIGFRKGTVVFMNEPYLAKLPEQADLLVCRLIQMFGNVVLDIEKKVFDKIFDAKKNRRKPNSIRASTPRRCKKLSSSTRRPSKSTPSVISRRIPTNSWSWRATPCSAPGKRPREDLPPHQRYR